MSARDAELVAFLQWALPRLRLRWRGFRRVRGQVGKRLRRRLVELGLGDLRAYRAHLEAAEHGGGGEWEVLDGLCRITISRFYRDRRIFDRLAGRCLPALAAVAGAAAADARRLRVWSAGCASGEEPYTVALLWHLDLAARHPDVILEVVATDASEQLLERARRARYERGSLRDLPPRLAERAFVAEGGRFVLREELRRGVRFLRQDIRRELPPGPFQLVLCRNLALTYFDEARQREVLGRVATVQQRGSLLVVGSREQLPPDTSLYAPLEGQEPLYVRR